MDAATEVGSWRSATIVVLLLAAAVVGPMAFLGTPDGHDIDFHMGSWLDTAEQWRAGEWFSGWAQRANYEFGEPRFVFYPPISRLVGTGLLVLLPSNAAPAAYFFLTVVIAGLSMFALARERLPGTHALVAAGFFAVSPYLLLCVYQRTAFAELLVDALFPLLLHFALRLGSGARAMAPLAIVFALVWLSDIPGAVVASYALAIAIAGAAAAQRSWTVLFRGVAAIVLGFALTAFYLVPALYEQRWINVGEAVTPDFLPQNWEYTWGHDPDAQWFYAMISWITFGGIGITSLAAAFAWRRRTRQFPWFAIATLSASTIFLLLPISHFAWTHLPRLEFVQFPWRWLLVLAPCMTLLLSRALLGARWLWLALVLLCMAFPAGFVAGKTAFWHRHYVTRFDAALQRERGYEGSSQFFSPDIDPDALKAQRATPRAFLSSHAGTAASLSWAPAHRILEVTPPQPERLILHLLYYPRWKATVNGRAVPIERDHLGRLAVPVSAGHSRVELTFAGTGYNGLGAGISLGALVFCGAFLLRKGS